MSIAQLTQGTANFAEASLASTRGALDEPTRTGRLKGLWLQAIQLARQCGYREDHEVSRRGLWANGSPDRD